MKYLSRSEAATKKDQAAALMRRTGQDDRAGEYESMSLEQYAESKGAQLLENPNRRRRIMPRAKSRAQLEAELDEAQDYIEDLEAKLDEIVGIAAEEEEEGAEDEDQD